MASGVAPAPTSSISQKKTRNKQSHNNSNSNRKSDSKQLQQHQLLQQHSHQQQQGGGGGGGASDSSATTMDDDIFQSISSKVGILHQPQITITCYIPTNCVGAVIGRRGSTIAQIQRYAQQVAVNGGPVRVSIVGHDSTTTTVDESNNNNNSSNHSNTNSNTGNGNNNTGNSNNNTGNNNSGGNSNSGNNNGSVPYTYSELDWSSPHWTPVVIRADPCGALAAAQRLQEMVDELDDVVMDVPLSRTKHAALVGKRGLVLANLSADTNVRIMVPRRELRHDVIQLEGELHKVKLCLHRVLGIASDAKSNNNNNSNNNTNSGSANNNGNNSGTNNRKHTRPSDKEDVSNIIIVSQLPSQTKLRSVGRKTDTIIKKKKMDDNWQLTVSGSTQEQVQSAISILQKWAEDAATNGNGNNNSTNNSENNSGSRSRNRGGRGGQQRNNNNRDKTPKGKNNKSSNMNRSESMP